MCSTIISLFTLSGSPSVTGLVYDSQSRTCTCTSTGGPATTVTWRRNGVLITLNATYQQTKRMTDISIVTYRTMLTIDPSVGQIVGTYNCTVENARGRSSMIVGISNNGKLVQECICIADEVWCWLKTYPVVWIIYPAFYQDDVVGCSFTVMVSLSAGENPILGQQYTLTCNVNVPSGSGTPTVQWVGPGNSTPITTGGDFTVANTSSTSYILTINPLRQSHAGQYICQANVSGDTVTTSVIVDIPGMCGYVCLK